MKPIRVWLTVIAVWGAGCGQTALDRAKVAGLTAKQTAETAYVTVRVEYLRGHVDEGTMGRAAALYEDFRRAQAAYIEILAIWEAGGAPADPAALQNDIASLAAALQAIADDVTRNSNTATTQPSGRKTDVQ